MEGDRFSLMGHLKTFLKQSGNVDDQSTMYEEEASNSENEEEEPKFQAHSLNEQLQTQ